MILVTGITPVREAYRPIRLPAVFIGLAWLADAILFGLPVVMIGILTVATGFGRMTLILIGAVVIAFVARRLVLARAKRGYAARWRATPTWHLSTSWALDDAGITITDGTFSTTISWGALTAVHKERDRLVFMQGLLTGHVLPIRFLDVGQDQLGAIEALVARVTQDGRLGRGS